jgi:hypothetical protein
MDVSRAILVVCITLFIVIGINAAIYVSVTRKNTIGQIELMRRAAKRARDPWKQENDDLMELSKRVADLKERQARKTNAR